MTTRPASSRAPTRPPKAQAAPGPHARAQTIATTTAATRPAPDPAPDPAALMALAERFAEIIDALCRALMASVETGPGRLASPLFRLARNSLQSIAAQFTAFATQAAAGALQTEPFRPEPRPRAPKPQPAKPSAWATIRLSFSARFQRAKPRPTPRMSTRPAPPRQAPPEFPAAPDRATPVPPPSPNAATAQPSAPTPQKTLPFSPPHRLCGAVSSFLPSFPHPIKNFQKTASSPTQPSHAHFITIMQRAPFPADNQPKNPYLLPA